MSKWVVVQMHEKDPFSIVSLNPSLSLYRTEAVCFRPAVSFSMAFSKPVLILCILSPADW